MEKETLLEKDMGAGEVMILPLEKQVSSLEPSRRLKELAVRQESLWSWVNYTINKKENCYTAWSLEESINDPNEHRRFRANEISAFTVAESLDRIPGYLKINGKTHVLMIGRHKEWIIQFRRTAEIGPDDPPSIIEFEGSNLADVVTFMRIHLIEKGLVKP